MTYLRLALLGFVIAFSCHNAVAMQKKEQQSAAISQAQAIQSARQRVDGRVLRVERTNGSFRIKMLQKTGRVVSVDVDRFTGRVTQQSSSQNTQKEQ